ncbi:carbohydrate sulfotransferase 5-like [Culicoides brevitarsis]|uniref:carbohydrate sulfotransferase 5-like n=1 Tax=Culicoides brevitarsis TaxID=469753 RepID=UPI00307BE500
MVRRENNHKNFKAFSLIFFCICCVLLLVTNRFSRDTIEELSDNDLEELKNIVIQFDDVPDEHIEVEENEVLDGKKLLDLEEVNLMRNYSLSNFVANVTKKQHNLVLASWRTGSTLTGDILKSYPRAFYHYEPFCFVQQHLHGLNSSAAQDVLKKLFLCKYDALDRMLEFNNRKRWLWSFNTQLWPFCNAFRPFCKSPKFLTSVCQIFPVQLVKTVRLGLTDVSAMLDDKDLNLKILLLVRDPRGVMNSRGKINWCTKSEDCMNMEMLCKRMEADYEEAKRIQKHKSAHIQVVRYEDLVSWPHRTTKSIFEFFGMEVTKEVVNYLNRNTMSQVGRTRPEIAAMMRRHGAVYSKWVHEMEFDDILEVQKYCKKAMELFGYREMDNWTEKGPLFETLSEFKF